MARVIRAAGQQKVSVAAILLALVVGLLMWNISLNQADAAGGANKVVANGSTIEVIEPNGTETLLSTTFKSSSPSDLLIQVTLECSILTRVHNQGGGDVDTSTGEAEGEIRVWAEFDGAIVPINSVSSNPQPQPGNGSLPGADIDKVTFCNRHHRFTVTDTEQQGPMDPPDGTDTYSTYLRTKTANAFNWVWLNTGNGDHTLVIKAQFTGSPTSTTCSDEDPANDAQNCASGLVGNRTVIVEPTHMANNTTV